MVEFNLSDEINKTDFGNEILGVGSVKEFIKRLKEELENKLIGCGKKMNIQARMPSFTCGICIYLCEECAKIQESIDNALLKLAGDKLIW